MILSKKGIKALVEKPLCVSKAFPGALEEEVKRIIEKAKERVIARKKKTLQPFDI